MDDVFTYDVDTSQWEALFSELNSRQLKSAWKAGLRPSAKTIERGVLTQLDRRHPAASKYRKEVKIKIWSKGGGYTVGLSQGQVESVIRNGKLIKNSHLYILRWLSGGTQERFTKKSARRGRIVGSHFFLDGVKNTIDPAVQRIGTDITKSLERAVARARSAKQK